MEYLWLFIGFVLLIKGADFFVDGSSSIARLLRVPSVIIGLTIVALGTSAPEAAVSISAGLIGENEIALSNVIGSNVFNLMIVVGVCACMRPFVPDKDIVNRDLPISFFAAGLLAVMLIGNVLGRIEGIVLLLLMVGYIALTVRSALKNRTEGEEIKTLSPLVSILYIVGGLAAVIWGGQLVVDNASLIAVNLGMSQTLVGLTIVAIGTSLPELVTSIVAAKKGDSGLALGNVVGSNIFNIFFILGMSSALTPIAGSVEAIIDMVLLLVFTLGVFLVGKFRGKIGRTSGAVMISTYVAYTAYIIMRAYNLI